jgi:hypothetical protein
MHFGQNERRSAVGCAETVSFRKIRNGNARSDSQIPFWQSIDSSKTQAAPCGPKSPAATPL